MAEATPRRLVRWCECAHEELLHLEIDGIQLGCIGEYQVSDGVYVSEPKMCDCNEFKFWYEDT